MTHSIAEPEDTSYEPTQKDRDRIAEYEKENLLSEINALFDKEEAQYKQNPTNDTLLHKMNVLDGMRKHLRDANSFSLKDLQDVVSSNSKYRSGGGLFKSETEKLLHKVIKQMDGVQAEIAFKYKA